MAAETSAEVIPFSPINILGLAGNVYEEAMRSYSLSRIPSANDIFDPFKPAGSGDLLLSQFDRMYPVRADLPATPRIGEIRKKLGAFFSAAADKDEQYNIAQAILKSVQQANSLVENGTEEQVYGAFANLIIAADLFASNFGGVMGLVAEQNNEGNPGSENLATMIDGQLTAEINGRLKSGRLANHPGSMRELLVHLGELPFELGTYSSGRASLERFRRQLSGAAAAVLEVAGELD